MKRVLGCVRRADERFNMIQDGDKICVGVSGGKDSLLLMYALKLYQNFSKHKFDVCGIMLDLGLEEQDTSSVCTYAERIGVPFEVLKTADLIKQMFAFFGKLFAGDLQQGDVAGPVGTIQIIGQAVRAGLEVVLMISVILSVNLGFINLLPLPALDGGRFVFMLIELIIKKPVPRNVEAIVHLVGFVLLIGLMVFLTVNDVSRLFG